MFNKDKVRFEATRRASDNYYDMIKRVGPDNATETMLAVLDATSGAMVGLRGEAFAYYTFQRIADDLAASMIETRAA